MKTGINLRIGKFPVTCWQGEFDFARDLRVGNVEFSLEYPHLGPSTYTAEQIERIKEGLRGLEIVIHPMPSVPYVGPETRIFDPASSDKDTRNYGIGEVLKSYEFARKIGARLVTIHGGYYTDEHGYGKHLELLRESLEELDGIARDYGIGLCLENLPSRHHSGNLVFDIARYPEDFAYLLRGLDNTGVTLDVGHANTIMHPLRFYRALIRRGVKVWNMHVHDNNGDKDEHLELGQGNIDFRELVKHLLETDYQGYFNLELDIDWGNSEAPSQKERRKSFKFLQETQK